MSLVGTKPTVFRYSLFQLIVLHFEKSQGYPTSGVTKSGVCMELKKYVDRDPTSLDRLYGRGTEYIGRLLSWLRYRCLRTMCASLTAWIK